MSEILTSGSAIERAMLCEASVALPHAHYESPYTRRGDAIHSFLEACTKVGRDEALKQCDEEFRDVCAELNLDGLDAQLNLAAEVSYAYNFVTDTARELGRGQGRAYGDVGDDEIPCTLDVVGVRDLPSRVRRGKYVEWKSGWSTRRRISLVAQIDFGALCVARTYGCDVVEGELVHVHEDVQPWVQRRVIESWELDAFASELREHAVRWRELRDRFLRGVVPTTFNTGPWCDRCSAREFCPAQATLVRSALRARDEYDGQLRTSLDTLTDAQLAKLWHELNDADSVIGVLKQKIRGIASTRKIYLGRTPDGLDRFLGTVISEGNEKLDGEHVFDVVASLPADTWKKVDGDEPITSEDVATKATKIVCTKKDLDAALKEALPRGKKAGVLRDIMKRLEAVPGAITTKTNVAIKEFTTKPALDTRSAPQLTDGELQDLADRDDIPGMLTPDDEAALDSLAQRGDGGIADDEIPFR